MLDLTKIPQRFLDRYGREKLCEVTGQTPALVSAWISKGSFPATAIQALLDHDPDPIHEIKPLYEKIPLGKKLMYCVPLSSGPTGAMMDTFAKLYDKAEMLYERKAFNAIHVSRNTIAARFLRSPAEWTFWNDGDNCHPANDAEWYSDLIQQPMPAVYAGLHTIYRLLWHRQTQKLPVTLVSTCYVGRKKGSAAQFGGGHTPEMRAVVRRGPQNKLIDVPWVGFGGCLVHRSVFEDIIKTQGNEIRVTGGVSTKFNYEYAFFHPESPEVPGDDIGFCHRAAKAGHKSYVDLALMSGHGIGDYLYTYADI